MDDFKLIRLSAINPKITEELSTIDGTDLKVQLINSLGLPQESTGCDIVMGIQKFGLDISGVHMMDSNVSLKDIFKELSLDVASRVYLNWYHFDTVDIIEFDTLCEYFDDIWYPSSDDIDIVDIDVKWVVCVDHDGYFKKLLL